MINGTPVDCYWNLHKHCYSIRARTGPQRGRVIAHSPAITLINATFVVNKAGLARARKEQQKNVHAYIRGEWGSGAVEGIAVTYNPYLYDTFVTSPAGEAIVGATAVIGITCEGKPRITI